MQILGQGFRHISFGDGVIKDVSGRYITIGFVQGDKKFLYPDAFSDFLELKDLEKQKILNKKNIQQQLQKKIEKKRELEQRERYWKIRNMKITPNSQAVFHVDFSAAKDIIESGLISTGCYFSGNLKGKPRIPSRLKPNSVCLITGLHKDSREKNRCILGAFMVEEYFLGEYCSDGIIKSHEKYRLLLNADDALPFWNYFTNNRIFSHWGNVPFKYFSNETMQDILYDMGKLLSGTKQESVFNEFYQYFSKMNGLPVRYADTEGEP